LLAILHLYDGKNIYEVAEVMKRCERSIKEWLDRWNREDTKDFKEMGEGLSQNLPYSLVCVFNSSCRFNVDYNILYRHSPLSLSGFCPILVALASFHIQNLNARNAEEILKKEYVKVCPKSRILS